MARNFYQDALVFELGILNNLLYRDMTKAQKCILVISSLLRSGA